ncbi:hypothetical protein [Occallatibacter riparius]|uniref:Neuromedin U n=1 Tax=Occallatibacter riparius TaxID=1002689 RepID=A0A9J7BXV3_9BACT|nr:hypothetical protein [Occallatibacter riparius]UWZ86093.1 hypothetical protein MOP44_09130 [Occallatibacter riparius]
MCRPAFVLFALVSVSCVMYAQSRSPDSSGGDQSNALQSKEELTQQLSNPVADLWLIANEINISDVKNLPGNIHVYNWNLQPVMSVHLGKTWNLINRPYMPFFFQSPTLSDKPVSIPLDLIDDSGLGDVGIVSLLSPNKPPSVGKGQLLWGLGPTFSFPTASQKTFGFGKWLAGPSGVAAYLDSKWVGGVFLQQWWSYAGDAARTDKNFAWIQYFAAYQFAPGWQVSTGAPIIGVDWNTNNVTFPVGVGIGHTAFLGKLPVQMGFEFQKTVVHPDKAPYQDNLFRITIEPVIPNLFERKK